MRVFISYFLLSILVVGAKASLKEAVVEATKEAPEACSLDVLACADGSVLDRDPNMDCQFPRCSCKNSDQCMRGECVEGTCRGGSDDDADDDEVDDGYTDDYYTNDDEKGDDYEPAACTQDVRQCRDGSSVGRISPYCEFEACPCYENRDCYQGEICEEEKCVEEDKGEICSSDVLECLDGSTVSRIPPACKFDRCSCRNSRDCRRGICFDGKCSDRSVQCTLDVRECDDGSFVGRVPPDCNFEECPEVVCPLDTLECLNGRSVGRVPPDCSFARCKCRDDDDCYKGFCMDRTCASSARNA